MRQGSLRSAMTAFAETARSPNLRRAQLSFLGAWISEWALTVALGILAFRDGGAAAVGVVAMARMLPSALLTPLLAVVVDRYRREAVLACVCLVRAVAIGAAALAVSKLSSPVPAYALAAVATLAGTLYRPAHSALLPSLCTTPLQLTSANVVRGLLDSASALVGPLAAGLLVGPIGVSGVFGLCAAASLWAALVIMRVRYDAPPRIEETAERSGARDVIEGLAVLRRPLVRTVAGLGFLQTVTRGCFTVFAVVIAIELLDSGETGVGVLTAGFGAGAVLGSLGAALLVNVSRLARWFGVGIALWGLPFVLLAPVSSQVLAFALLAVVGVGNALVDVTGFTVLQRIVPDDVAGRFFAALESVFQLGIAIGSIMTPGLIALLGTRGALVAAGVIAPAGVVLAWGSLHRIDASLTVSGRVIGLLQRVSMFGPLPLATIARLAERTSSVRAASGTTVVAEGDTGDEFFVIERGRAEVLQGGTRLRHLDVGDCFGEIAALGRHARTSSVRAETELELVRLSGAQFVRAITGYVPSHVAAQELIDERLARSATMTGDLK